MYQSYYGMSCNPFSKEVDIHHSYESHDFKELIYRFQYLTEIKGIEFLQEFLDLGKRFPLEVLLNL